MSAPLYFLLGIYACGFAFSYLMMRCAVEYDEAPSWQKYLAAIAVGLLWPVSLIWMPVACAWEWLMEKCGL